MPNQKITTSLSNHELSILAIAVLDRSYAEKFDDESFEQYPQLAKAVKKYKRITDIASNYEITVHIEMLKRRMDLLRNLDLNAEFYNSLKELKKQRKAREAQELIYRCLEMMTEGHYNSAVSKLKSLDYFSEEAEDGSSVITLLERNETIKIASGIRQIDSCIDFGGFYLGNLLTIAGDKGSMKTRFSLYLILQMLMENPGIRGIYFEKEMSLQEIKLILLAKASKTTKDEIATLCKYNDSVAIDIMTDMVKNNKALYDALKRLTLVSPEGFDTVEDMYEYIDREKAQVFVLDFLQIMGENVGKDSELDFIWRQSRELKSLARTTNSLGIVLAQFKQNMVEKSNLGNATYIEYGSRLAQYSAYIFTTFRPASYMPNVNKDYFYIVCDKNRFGSDFNATTKTKYFFNFQAKPEIESFVEPTVSEAKEQTEFLKNYIRSRR